MNRMGDDLERLNRLLDDLAQERDPGDRAALSAEEVELAETAALLKAAHPERSTPDPEFVERLGARLGAGHTATRTDSGGPRHATPEPGAPKTAAPTGVSRRGLLGRVVATAAGLAVGAGMGSAAAYERGKHDGYREGEGDGASEEERASYTTPLVPHDRGAWHDTGHTVAGGAPGSAKRFRVGAVAGFVVNPGSGRPFYALSAACTHMGCMISWLGSANTFLCPCHGAQYNADGTVLSGIARHPLPRLRLRTDAHGKLYVWAVGEHPTVTAVEPYTRP